MDFFWCYKKIVYKITHPGTPSNIHRIANKCLKRILRNRDNETQTTNGRLAPLWQVVYPHPTFSCALSLKVPEVMHACFSTTQLPVQVDACRGRMTWHVANPSSCCTLMSGHCAQAHA